jgi:precorrin-2 dehydrogenase/sirohydrochlorin ferrochelatase
VKFYPLFLNLKDRGVLLVGAGEIGLQKIRALLECEARIHVVAPEALPEIQEIARAGHIRWSVRGYETADLEDIVVAIAATDDRVLQERIASECRSRKILVNIVDVPPLCDFYAASVVSRGDVQIAISTGGAAPALAKFLRQKVEGVLGPEYADFVRIVQGLRPSMLQLPKERRLSLWSCIVSDGFLDQIRREGPERAEAQIKQWIEESARAC